MATGITSPFELCQMVHDVVPCVLCDVLRKYIPEDQLLLRVLMNTRTSDGGCRVEYFTFETVPYMYLHPSSLYSLIRNLANIPPPKAGWGKSHQSSDSSLAANVDRLRELNALTDDSIASGILLPYMEGNYPSEIWNRLATDIIACFERQQEFGTSNYSTVQNVEGKSDVSDSNLRVYFDQIMRSLDQIMWIIACVKDKEFGTSDDENVIHKVEEYVFATPKQQKTELDWMMLNVLPSWNVLGENLESYTEALVETDFTKMLILHRETADILNMNPRGPTFPVAQHRDEWSFLHKFYHQKHAYCFLLLVDGDESLAHFDKICNLLINACGLPQCPYRDIQSLSDCLRDNPTWRWPHVFSFLRHSKGNIEAARPLFEIDIEFKMDRVNKQTDLMAAILEKRVHDVHKLLLLDEKSIESTDEEGDTPYHYAVRSIPHVILMLFAHDKKHVVDCINKKGETALLLACRMELPEAVKTLLEAQADPSITGCDELPVNVAAKANDLKSLKLICNKHPKQLAVKEGKDGKCAGTPLHWAETVEAVKLLGLLKCEVNAINEAGKSALQIMVEKNKPECVAMLLCLGAYTTKPDNDGSLPLFVAIERDDVDMVRTLAAFGADVNVSKKCSPETTALHRALQSLNKETKEKMGNLLHLFNAERCKKGVDGCVNGCKRDGSNNGTTATPDKDMDAFLDKLEMKLDKFKDSTTERGRVLCLDGGGIRGITMVYILNAIEREVKLINKDKSIKDCFDWIGGTSTGALLALGIATDKTLSHMRLLYTVLGTIVFKDQGSYGAEKLEEHLKEQYGEDEVMTSINPDDIKVLITGVLADRRPAELHLFRNYTLAGQEVQPDHQLHMPAAPGEQRIWNAARASCAAPTYFKPFDGYVDGGLVANNPTLDVLTEIHQEHRRHTKTQNDQVDSGASSVKHDVSVEEKDQEADMLARQTDPRPSESDPQPPKKTKQAVPLNKLTIVLSLGTGRIPVKTSDVPDLAGTSVCYAISNCLTIWKQVNVLKDFLIDQATLSEGTPVDRARAWCDSIDIPFGRLNPMLSKKVHLNCSDINEIGIMIEDTQKYINENKQRISRLAKFLAT